MGVSYVSRITFEGNRDKLEHFRQAFEQEGFELIKSVEAYDDEDSLMEWRSNNWGVYVNLEPRQREGRFTDEGTLKQAYETYRSPPFDFLKRATGMFGISCTVGAVDDYLTNFLYAKFSDGEDVIYEDEYYICERSIDFYGEAHFSDELNDAIRRYLKSEELEDEMDNALLEELAPLGIKKLLLDGTFFEKSMVEALEDTSI